MKKSKLMTASIFMATMMMASCGSNKTALQPEALDGEWNIITVNGKQASSSKQAYIGMDLQAQRLYGCAGCNRIMGSVQVENGKAGLVNFGKIGSTRMLCPDMSTETAVLEALGNVTGYKGTERELTLTDKKGKELLTLSKRPEASLVSLNGKWHVAAIYGQAIESTEDTEETPYLEFNAAQKTIHGYAGCNIINGETLQKEGNPTSLEFDKLLATMKACPNMETESKMLEAMNNTRSFVVQDEAHAVLLDENGKEAISLSKE